MCDIILNLLLCEWLFCAHRRSSFLEIKTWSPYFSHVYVSVVAVPAFPCSLVFISFLFDYGRQRRKFIMNDKHTEKERGHSNCCMMCCGKWITVVYSARLQLYSSEGGTVCLLNYV